jgi:hypothetical protein
MIEYWDFYLYGYEAPHSGQGTATTLPFEPEEDAVEKLHAAVEEVTGALVIKQPKQRMGFL